MSWRAISRRRFVQVSISSLLSFPSKIIASVAAAPNECLVGAIRWDAWYAPSSNETQAVERALTPEEYHYRIPFFGKIRSDGSVLIDGNRQSVMDREIRLAVGAGIDFWAFDAYDYDAPMSLGLRLYLSSKVQRKPRFCMLASLGAFEVSIGQHNGSRWHAKLMRESSYIRVMGNRPLYFFIGMNLDEVVGRWGSIDGFNNVIADFRRYAQALTGQDPYLVADPFGTSLDWVRNVNVDAVWHYATGTSAGHQSYSSLSAFAAESWDRLAAIGLSVVPTAMCGWDRRPRVLNPVPWEAAWQKPGQGSGDFYDEPTVTELAQHIRAAIEWVKDHKRKEAPAGVMLVYAWNENDEGGWLVPTLGGDQRLEAIRRARRKM